MASRTGARTMRMLSSEHRRSAPRRPPGPGRNLGRRRSRSACRRPEGAFTAEVWTRIRDVKDDLMVLVTSGAQESDDAWLVAMRSAFAPTLCEPPPACIASSVCGRLGPSTEAAPPDPVRRRRCWRVGDDCEPVRERGAGAKPPWMRLAFRRRFYVTWADRSAMANRGRTTTTA